MYMDKNKSLNITENIKIKFTKIKSMRNHIKDKFSHIQKIKSQIRNNYINYMNKESNDFFGLDSFHFQNKVLELEFSNMTKLYQFIDNRIYGDYYKLFVDIEIFLKKTLKDKQYDKIKELKNIEKYPIYKDLDKFTCYDFDTINNIHQDIIVIISCIKEIYNENENVIKEDMKQLNTGINIDNYIINNQYKNAVILTTNMKFENYLQVYHKYHYDLLHKFFEKLSLCLQHINHNPNDERFIESEPSDTSSADGEINNSQEDILNDTNTNFTPKTYDSAIKRNSFLAPKPPSPEIDEAIEDISKYEPNLKNSENIIITNSVNETQEIINPEKEVDNNITSLNTEDENVLQDEFQTVTKRKKKRNRKKNNNNNNNP